MKNLKTNLKTTSLNSDEQKNSKQLLSDERTCICYIIDINGNTYYMNKLDYEKAKEFRKKKEKEFNPKGVYLSRRINVLCQ